MVTGCNHLHISLPRHGKPHLNVFGCTWSVFLEELSIWFGALLSPVARGSTECTDVLDGAKGQARRSTPAVLHGPERSLTSVTLQDLAASLADGG